MLQVGNEREPVFTPDTLDVAGSQLTAFMRFCEGETGFAFADQAEFHRFSVEDYRRFWSLFLRWSELICTGSSEPVCTADSCETALFFPELRMSYVENLLQIPSIGDGQRLALTARHHGAPTQHLTRRELADRVAALSGALLELGVRPGDRVATIAGNTAETVIAGLAVAAVGATFSTASPEMGALAILDRFRQLDPSILITVFEVGAEQSPLPLACRVADVVQGLPSLTSVISFDDGPVPEGIQIPVHRFNELVASSERTTEQARPWPQFSFNHPLFVLFSSGTTGPPKCIVHGAGGTLLEHLKEHRLHVDLRAGEKLFFHTSAAWMMWNWQLSALASGAHLVLYDGPITGPHTLWEIVSEEEVNVLGTSPPYLKLCEEEGFSPSRAFPLDALRSVLSTGSILGDLQFDWLAEHVGDVAVQSISGGTDIIGCFVLGSPNLPVYRGEIQCRSLGLDVQALRADGATTSGVGELVCFNPFPSRPLGLYGDEDGSAFHRAYFDQNPGLWTHGDLIEFSERETARLYGRSDGVLNIRGARIGPAEIYAVLDRFPEIREAMAVEYQPPGVSDEAQILLLVVLRRQGTLDDALRTRIRRQVARDASPTHVPALIVAVEELPTTHSGKRSERAARDAVNGLAVKNLEALRNPSCLSQIQGQVALAAELVGSQPPMTGTRAEGTLIELQAIWERVLGISPIGPDDNYFDLGGTSLASLRLFREIYERLGQELPLSTLLDAPTPGTMAAVIDGGHHDALPLLIPLIGRSEGTPLFMVHNAFGEIVGYRSLALQLRYEGPVYAIRVGGLDPRELPHTRVEDMADYYLSHVRREQPEGPYALVGHSLGGLIAFEMARRLRQAGDDVSFVGIIDSDLHESCLPFRERVPFELKRLCRRILLAAIAPREKLFPFVQRHLRRAFPALRGTRELESTTPSLERVHAAAMEAFRSYRPQTYEGSATFFQAKVRRLKFLDPHPACSLRIWSRVAEGGLVVKEVPGGHTDLLREPHVAELARELSGSLAAQPFTEAPPSLVR